MAEEQRPRLIMYSSDFCPTCVKARQVLSAEGVDYEERMLDDVDEWQAAVLANTKQATVPVFLHPDGKWEVGFRGERG